MRRRLIFASVGMFVLLLISSSGIEMQFPARSFLAVSIPASLALPNVGRACAQSPQNSVKSMTHQPEAASSSMSTDTRAGLGIGPARGAAEALPRDTGRSNLVVPSVRAMLSTARPTALRVDNEVFSRNADNWKRARIVGYTLGALAACVVAYAFYSVVTGT